MNTNEIIREIKRLPVSKRIYVVEKTMRSIRTQEDEDIMKKAADALYSDYKTNTELKVFTNLDFEGFYETK
jgi:hypothetical protein